MLCTSLREVGKTRAVYRPLVTPQIVKGDFLLGAQASRLQAMWTSAYELSGNLVGKGAGGTPALPVRRAPLRLRASLKGEAKGVGGKYWNHPTGVGVITSWMERTSLTI